MRISVTTIDDYLYYLLNPDKEKDDLIAGIKREKEPTEPMIRSRYFHQIMDRFDEYCVSGSERITVPGSGYDFETGSILELLRMLPSGGVNELKAEQEYQTRYGPVTVVGKVDKLIGRVIYDYKWPNRFDVDKYAASCQWKFYMDMFKGLQFNYLIALFGKDRKTGLYRVRESHLLPLYPYPTMKQDLRGLLTDFLRFVEMEGLEGYLQPREKVQS